MTSVVESTTRCIQRERGRRSRGGVEEIRRCGPSAFLTLEAAAQAQIVVGSAACTETSTPALTGPLGHVETFSNSRVFCRLVELERTVGVAR